MSSKLHEYTQVITLVVVQLILVIWLFIKYKKESHIITRLIAMFLWIVMALIMYTYLRTVGDGENGNFAITLFILVITVLNIAIYYGIMKNSSNKTTVIGLYVSWIILLIVYFVGLRHLGFILASFSSLRPF